MRRLTFAVAAALLVWTACAQDIVLMTWNMKWFPSGKADLRISPEFEAFKTKRAGMVLAELAAEVGYVAGDGLVVVVEEMRGADVCSTSCGRRISGLHVRLHPLSRFWFGP